ncbi:hypothetical protein CPB86DRAFT_546789 [Serendipita vermifera]|nr:hypothetical protein CPB86DRAFT_546789 [Serendipita vermifera]
MQYLQSMTSEAPKFEKSFITLLCGLLTGSFARNIITDLRQAIAKFFSELLPKHPKASKWLLESKLIGVVGLGTLITTTTEFRLLDVCFEMTMRLTPKRSDPQARRAFLTDVFYSTSARTIFGDKGCKRIMEIIDRPQKGSSWFEICDSLFTEISNNMKMPQRFMIESLVVCGHSFKDDHVKMRMFMDSEITLSIFSPER